MVTMFGESFYENEPIMTVKEARKILDKKARELSDDEIEVQIRCMMVIARKLLDKAARSEL
jgi:hypothetical protein